MDSSLRCRRHQTRGENKMKNEGFLFDEWIETKKTLHFARKLSTINEGEIWWCGIGKNVGVEINGKSNRFSRPVLIVKKLSRFGFLGVPLTSQPKIGSWYVSFEFQEKKETAVLCQVRTLSVSRLYNKLGMVPRSDLEKVKVGLYELYR